jgi:hypothetical protein
MTKPKIVLLSLWLAFTSAWLQKAETQNIKCRFYGEGDKNIVRLMWLPESWPQNLSGFDIKRRHANGEWELLNKTPIIPEMSLQKDLGNVEPSASERERLKDKLKQMIDKGKTKEITNEAYLNRLRTDTNAVYALYVPVAVDYDFALLNGFGLVDRTIKPGENEYGLFPIINGKPSDKPVATYKWTYGTSPDLNVKVTPTVKPAAKGKLQISWTVDAAAYKKLNINGFNVYRKTKGGDLVKLNSTPIWINTNTAQPVASYYDDVKENTIYTYAIVPNSLFGTEGPRTTVDFDPAKLPPPVAPPKLYTNPDRKTPGPGIEFNWDFEKSGEKDIKGFILARKGENDKEYKAHTEMLKPETRSYLDTKDLVAGKYYTYRLSAIRKDGAILRSNELLLLYIPTMKPLPPVGLKGTWEQEGDHFYILLEWKPNPKDTLAKSYHIYASSPPDRTLMWQASIPEQKGISYKYEVFNDYEATYRFAMTAMSRYGQESSLSDSIEVFTPTTLMPDVRIWPFTVDSNRITLNWDYKTFKDLKGFRLFQDGDMIADEKVLGKDTRKWVSGALQYGTRYTYELMAVSTYGVMGRKSLNIVITTEDRVVKK